MGYAILQKDLNAPSVDQLKRAFRVVKTLTEYDAFTLARDAYGILVKKLSIEDATALQGTLKVEGIETEIVDEQTLPAMPQGKFIHRVDCLPEHLMIYDPLGRNFPLEWGHIMMIAAGSVRVHEFYQQKIERPVTRYPSDQWGSTYTEYETETRHKEQMSYHWLLEIILSRAVLRYSTQGDKFNFVYLGERQSRDLKSNFTLLIQDLAKFAPQAAVNRGAFYARENAAATFSYPSKNAFFEEIIWLLWRMAKAGKS